MDFTASGAREGEIPQPATQPHGRQGGFEQLSGIDRVIDLAGEFSEVVAVHDPATLGRIEHRDSTIGDIPDRDQESTGEVETEGVEPDPFGHRAEDESAGDREPGDTLKHEVEIHRVGMGNDVAASAESKFLEEGLVEVREDAVHAAGALHPAPAGQVRHLAADAVSDALQPSVGGIRIEIGTPMGTQRQGRIDEIAIAIEVGKGGAISVGPVDHGGSLSRS